MSTTEIENPIINSPYDPPACHFELDEIGVPTRKVVDGRRPSESFVPVPAPRKQRDQQALDFDPTGERRDQNSLINDIRFEVDRWRVRDYPGATAISRKLLDYWSAEPPLREEPVFFCQREAVETAIFLAEVAGRHGHADYRTRIDPSNLEHNDGLSRIALKMATATGKTVVMAMLIAWQTLNKAFNPSDNRFAKRFLVVTPGITIKDRLRVLEPTDPHNFYRERDLVPSDLWEALLHAQVVITNYHTFLLKDAKEIQGVAANTRKILRAGKKSDPFRETLDEMAARVLRDFTGRGKGEIVVLNDEAHHCYRDKPLTDPSEVDPDEKEEVAERNEDARVWLRGLQAVRKKVGIKTIYDLSATPYYLRGSGWTEGYIFPWTVSDFSLMDAIESGIVKVPRVPVDDDAAGNLVTYLRLWDHVGSQLPKKKTAKLEAEEWIPPEELQGALDSLYRSYERRFRDWEKRLRDLDEPPPVMIIVCPNTLVSKLVYEYVGGRNVELDDGTTRLKPGRLSLLSNVDDGVWTSRPRTILVDSAQLERGDVLGRDFKQAASHEIETFKHEYLRRHPGADIEQLDDSALLREVMNTVGKKGMLGEHVRCVVSVAMLTEGWDANTVTHVLGIRRFGSQLLCEQVVGRALRRRSYAPNEEQRFEPEYAEVYGVPFSFIPARPPGPEPPPRPPAVEVYAVTSRSDLRIRFPKLDGYRFEIPERLHFPAFDDEARLHIERSAVATWVELAGLVGEHAEEELDKYRHARVQEVAYRIASVLVQRKFVGHDGAPKPWLFPELVEMTRLWLETCVTVEAGSTIGLLVPDEATNRAAEKLANAIARVEYDRDPIVVPLLRAFDPEGSTDDVYFATRKAVIPADRSHVNLVVLDGPKGNTWEEGVAGLLERHDRVASYVKNDHLDFTIPYVYEGRTHPYEPDFLVHLEQRPDDIERTLIVEVSGGKKAVHSPGPVSAKADTAQFQWCAAVNNHGGFGRWGYVEIKDMTIAESRLDGAIENLYADGTVTGLRDVVGAQ